jgi:hypothetical protein
MLNQLLPPRADNAYRGHNVALWLFALLLFVKTAMSVNTIFNGYHIASAADGIPLDTFTPAGARAVVAVFASAGLARLMICFLCMLVLLRYRSLIPFMFALLLVEHLGKQLILYFLPIARRGTPPGHFINLFLFLIVLSGLVLSLRDRGSPRGPLNN